MNTLTRTTIGLLAVGVLVAARVTVTSHPGLREHAVTAVIVVLALMVAAGVTTAGVLRILDTRTGPERPPARPAAPVPAGHSGGVR